MSDHCLAYSPDVMAGSSLNNTRRMSVRVVAKPPDESSRRLETTPLDSLSSVPPYRPLIPTGVPDRCSRGLNGPGVLSHTPTITVPSTIYYYYTTISTKLLDTLR